MKNKIVNTIQHHNNFLCFKVHMIRVRLHVITSMIRQKKSKQPGAFYQEISKFDKKKIGVTKRHFGYCVT